MKLAPAKNSSGHKAKEAPTANPTSKKIRNKNYRGLKLPTAVPPGTQWLTALIPEMENLPTPGICSLWILTENLKDTEHL